MSKFKTAISEGLRQAEEAQANLDEIQSLLDELNSELDELSRSKVAVKVKNIFKPFENNSPFAQGLLGQIAGHGKNVEVLVAFNPQSDGRSDQELCEWQASEKGYPVNIRYGSINQSAGDIQALAEALSELIKNPATGKKIKKFIDAE
jgi:hypothetical protein